MAEFPTIRQVVLDTADVRGLAEFYRRMFGLTYGPGDEPPRRANRAIELGARVIQDRSDDPEEPIRVFGDPSGHLFCIFVAP
jgi:hypothetical protein